MRDPYGVVDGWNVVGRWFRRRRFRKEVAMYWHRWRKQVQRIAPPKEYGGVVYDRRSLK